MVAIVITPGVAEGLARLTTPGRGLRPDGGILGGGRGGEQPLSAQRRSGNGVARRRAGAEHTWRTGRPRVDQEAEELLAVTVPAPANFAAHDEEALWPRLE